MEVIDGEVGRIIKKNTIGRERESFGRKVNLTGFSLRGVKNG